MSRRAKKLTPISNNIQAVSINRGTPHALTVGWEWEIPYKTRRGYTRPAGFNIETLKAMGYKNHEECGGLEVGSPVCPTVTQARGFAKQMMQMVSGRKEFDHEGENPIAFCGIHVHVSHPSFTSLENYAKVFPKVYNLMHRLENLEFFKLFSKRKAGVLYYENCLPLGRTMDFDDVVEYFKSGDHPHSYNSCMVRINAPTACTWIEWSNGPKTIEFRLWNAKPDRLLPAIDFAHSMVRFCMSTRIKEPTLQDWKSWLLKQKGYTILKQQPEIATL